MPYFWQLAINPKLKIQLFPLGMLILMQKIFLILYPPFEKSTTRIAIACIRVVPGCSGPPELIIWKTWNNFNDAAVTYQFWPRGSSRSPRNHFDIPSEFQQYLKYHNIWQYLATVSNITQQIATFHNILQHKFTSRYGIFKPCSTSTIYICQLKKTYPKSLQAIS